MSLKNALRKFQNSDRERWACNKLISLSSAFPGTDDDDYDDDALIRVF